MSFLPPENLHVLTNLHWPANAVIFILGCCVSYISYIRVDDVKASTAMIVSGLLFMNTVFFLVCLYSRMTIAIYLAFSAFYPLGVMTRIKVFNRDANNRQTSKIIFCSTPDYITPQSTHTADQIDALNYDSAPVRWQIA